jgi:hypothetical protein
MTKDKPTYETRVKIDHCQTTNPNKMAQYARKNSFLESIKSTPDTRRGESSEGGVFLYIDRAAEAP